MESTKLLLIISLFLLIQISMSNKIESIDIKDLYKEIEGCYNYFMDTTNLKEDSKGFGLTQDRLTDPTLSSIAATGLLLGSYPVFVESKLMEFDTAKTIVSKTFDTILKM